MGKRVELVDRAGLEVVAVVGDTNPVELVVLRKVVHAYDERDLALAEVGLDFGSEQDPADPQQSRLVERGHDLALHTLGLDRRLAVVVLVHRGSRVEEGVCHLFGQHHLRLHHAVELSRHVGCVLQKAMLQ